MQITLNTLLFSLSHALDYVEQELLGITTNHGKRTAYTSMRLGRTLGMSDQEVFDIASCGVLHDNALTNYMLEAGPGSFTRLENLEVHCPLGEKNASTFPFLGDVSGAILHHHENWNGRGYHKLAGDDIPPMAAVIRLADNMDLALRMGDGREDLEEKIRTHAAKFSGTLYSPKVVEALLDIIGPDFIDELKNDHIDQVLSRTVPAVGRDLTTKQILDVCRIFAVIIDAKSPFTRNHSQGIAQKARFMGQVYGFDETHCDKLEIAGSLHDVGKLSTPVAILEKPGPLTKEEFVVMKNHVWVSWDILKDVAGLEDITAWAVSHHEKLDGSGYPFGRSAGDLCFECRLMTCCDIFQALTEDRPYRPGLDHGEVSKMMREMARKGFIDGDILETMLRELAPAGDRPSAV